MSPPSGAAGYPLRRTPGSTVCAIPRYAGGCSKPVDYPGHEQAASWPSNPWR